MLGNWIEHRRNADGDGTGAAPSFTGDEVDARGHNAANELLQRTLDPGGAGQTPLPQTFDAAGRPMHFPQGRIAGG